MLVLPRKTDGFRDHYRTLNIDSTAEDAAIKSAFRRLALRHHPDRARDKDAAGLFEAIREAYEVIASGARRSPLRGRTGPADTASELRSMCSA